jgi:hypothetical protein
MIGMSTELALPLVLVRKDTLQGTQTKFDYVPEQEPILYLCTVGEEYFELHNL